MANQAELAQALADLTSQLTKASGEILAKIAVLEQAIVDAGNVTPEVEAALSEAKAAAQSLDDIVPDVV